MYLSKTSDFDLVEVALCQQSIALTLITNYLRQLFSRQSFAIRSTFPSVCLDGYV